jgi:Anti-sigma factor NepR
MTKRKDDDSGQNSKEGHHVRPATLTAGQSAMNAADPHDQELPALDSHIQGLIGRQLQAHYGTLVNDKIPDKLLKLLDELAKSEQRSKKDS